MKNLPTIVFLAVLGLCCLFVVSWALPSSLFSGKWIAEQSETMGITRISFFPLEDGKVEVHVWSRCRPVECHWGSAQGTSLSLSRPALFLTWRDQWSVKHQYVEYLSDGRLSVTTYTQFLDDNGYNRHIFQEYFLPG